MSKKLITLAFVSVAALAAASPVRAKSWRGLTPLKSTRAEVERVLGPPVLASESKQVIRHVYRADKLRITVDYSVGKCFEGVGGWRVPRESVTDIHITPDEMLPAPNLKQIDDLDFGSAKFTRVFDPHDESTSYYVNSEEGVAITIKGRRNEDKWVESVTFYPPDTEKHLRCPNPPPTPGYAPGYDPPPPDK
jgi:hypothetical protein